MLLINAIMWKVIHLRHLRCRGDAWASY